MIRQNQHKYSVSAMCAVLKLAKSTFYYEAKEKDTVKDDEVTNLITAIFHQCRQNYGTRKIKHELHKKGHTVSRRKIGRIMKEQGLVSKYTVAQFKPTKKTVNESEQSNTLDRQFEPNKSEK
ncbi:IS3 family transposase [Terribacillus sp. DMT04]|nr:IS3 family transposase [Terribacillus sp. DMT04]